MTLPVDTLHTALACLSVCGAGALAVAVLPWRQQDLHAAARAWTTLFQLVRRTVASVWAPTPLLPPRPPRGHALHG